ncbi:MAG: hypothetical protein ACK4F4_05180 [Hylemonella sp.]|uniref:hypothetical protein n=1 Tax=Hylemonella sp. TaxID=2066020 RepID=UPI00391B0211
MKIIQIPVTAEPESIRWGEIELFRRRFNILWDNLQDLKIGRLSGGFFRQANGRYIGGFELPNSYRLKGLYVDFRHFYLNNEPTNFEKFTNYLRDELTESKIFHQFIKNEKKRSRSDFLENGWFDYNGERISAEKFLDVFFNVEIFHSNRGRNKKTWKTETLLEWMNVFSDDTAKSMLFMAVYDSILKIKDINWVVMEFSKNNLNLRIPEIESWPKTDNQQQNKHGAR